MEDEKSDPKRTVIYQKMIKETNNYLKTLKSRDVEKIRGYLRSKNNDKHGKDGKDSKDDFRSWKSSWQKVANDVSKKSEEEYDFFVQSIENVVKEKMDSFIKEQTKIDAQKKATRSAIEKIFDNNREYIPNLVSEYQTRGMTGMTGMTESISANSFKNYLIDKLIDNLYQKKFINESNDVLNDEINIKHLLEFLTIAKKEASMKSMARNNSSKARNNSKANASMKTRARDNSIKPSIKSSIKSSINARTNTMARMNTMASIIPNATPNSKVFAPSNNALTNHIKHMNKTNKIPFSFHPHPHPHPPTATATPKFSLSRTLRAQQTPRTKLNPESQESIRPSRLLNNRSKQRSKQSANTNNANNAEIVPLPTQSRITNREGIIRKMRDTIGVTIPDQINNNVIGAQALKKLEAAKSVRRGKSK